MNHIYVTSALEDTRHLFIGINDPSDSMVYENLSMVCNEEGVKFGEKRSIPETMEFIPLHRVGELPGVADWDGSVSEDETAKVLDYINVMKRDPAILERAWKEGMNARAVFTRVLVVALNGEQPCVLSEDKSMGLHLEPETVDEIRSIIGRTFNESDVFVSRQVLLPSTALTQWKDLYDQAYSRLVFGDCYWRSTYDTQTFEAGRIYTPVFVIPVSVAVDLPRRMYYEDFTNIVKYTRNAFPEPEDKDDLRKALHKTDPRLTPCSLELIPPKDIYPTVKAVRERLGPPMLPDPLSPIPEAVLTMEKQRMLSPNNLTFRRWMRRSFLV